MKKLSEIGTHCKPDPDSTTQFEEHWIMTRDERRELVREAIHYFCMKPYSSPETHEEFCARLGEFIKEQGL